MSQPGSSEKITLEVDEEGIARLRLRDADNQNRFSLSFVGTLRDHLRALAADRSAKASLSYCDPCNRLLHLPRQASSRFRDRHLASHLRPRQLSLTMAFSRRVPPQRV